jgi:predicted acetyltransferase
MNIEIVKIEEKDRSFLWNLLQFALYDGSFYVENHINEQGLFDYKWFDNYFTDNDRSAYFIKFDNKIVGFAMVNENLKVKHDSKAQSIAEFLILPQFRKNHIGKIAAYKIFDMYNGEWEVQPMENNDGAYEFWKKIIIEYSKDSYKLFEFDDMEDVFVFKSKNNK